MSSSKKDPLIFYESPKLVPQNSTRILEIFKMTDRELFVEQSKLII